MPFKRVAMKANHLGFGIICSTLLLNGIAGAGEDSIIKPGAAGSPHAIAAEDEAEAYAQIQKLSSAPQSTPDDLVKLQIECRDFCRRFPYGKHYFEVRRCAVIYWTLLNFMGKPPAIDGWDATDAEHDPKLNPEQQADIAMLLANDRALKNHDGEKSFAEKQFEAVVAILPSHRATDAARNALVDAALRLPPERASDALAELRKNYPKDSDASQAASLIGQLGKPCEVHGTTLDGRAINSHDYLGKIVLLEFWSRGCSGCIAAIPTLKELAEGYAARRFVIIGVNMDTKAADAQKIIQKYDLRWPQIFDGGGWHAALADRFMVNSIPRGVIIDRQGRLAALDLNVNDSDAREWIDKLLSSQPPVKTETKID